MVARTTDWTINSCCVRVTIVISFLKYQAHVYGIVGSVLTKPCDTDADVALDCDDLLAYRSVTSCQCWRLL